MQKRNLTPSTLVLFLVVSLGSTLAVADPLLNGVATHTELSQEQFIAGLYTSTLSTERNEILLKQEDKRMQVRVTADSITPRRFRRMWIEGMAINASSSELEKHSENMAAFSNMLRVRLAAGDIFTVDRTSAGVDVIINGTTLGTVNDPTFFDLLLRTWIGPVPLSSNFRESLLKAGDVDPDILARFEATRPTDERIAAIETAIQSRPAPQPEQEVARVETPPVDTAPAVTRPAIAPPIAGTTSAIAPPDLTPAAPQQQASASQSTPSPRPTAVPSPRPTQVAVAPKPTTASSRNNVLEEEEEEEEFTAASLLQQQLYIAELKRWSNKFTEYPRRALERNQQGTVRVSVTIDRQGQVKNAEVIEETKHSLLNKGAISIIEDASPYPAIPDEIKGENFTFSFPIIFQIQ